MLKIPFYVWAAMTAAAGVSQGYASAPASVSQPPLIPVKTRADGALIVTHMVKISGRMIRFPGKMPEANGPLAFLADTDGLRAGRVAVTTAQADAALAELSRITSQEVHSTPGVQAGVGIPARMAIGQELRYPAGWSKNPEPAGGWMASRIETRSLGVSLMTESQLAADGSIQLGVTVETTELDGFIEREGPDDKTTSATEFFAANEPAKSGAPQPEVNMGPHASPFFEPVFSTTTVTGSGRIANGATLVLVGNRERPEGKPETLLVFVSANAWPLKPVSAPAAAK